jgi:hydrogenase maturation protein HypF
MDALRSADALAARLRLRVRGLVQGVGFRPFVHTLARRHGLAGWVANDGHGVLIEVEGAAAGLFVDELRRFAPPLARIDAIETTTLERRFEEGFRIAQRGEESSVGAIEPDTAPCDACLAAMFDPADHRRWRYPFVACAQCGPRYTVAAAADRVTTAPAEPQPCPDCAAEAADPGHRCYGAPAPACSACGPRLSHPIEPVTAKLAAGGIVAVKGTGGFQLLCDARDRAAVARLRRRTGRTAEPLAVLVANLATARRVAHVDAAAAALLTAPARPIVVVPRRKDAGLADDVAPGLASSGVALPATPLHYLLFHEAAGRPTGTAWLDEAQDAVWVATGVGRAGEPPSGDDDARHALEGIADLVLGDDRTLGAPAADSVVQPDPRGTVFVRRGRGWVPEPVRLARRVPAVVALGAGGDTTICVASGDAAVLSPPLGDPATAAGRHAHDDVRGRLVGLLDVHPEAVAHDLDPEALSTRTARTLGTAPIAVQHHHAHLAAVAAEHGHEGPLLGLALDGGGFGPDGTIWGGELMEVDGPAYRRLARLVPLPQPGGERAAREPWRMAAAALHVLGRGDEIADRFKGQPLAASLDAVVTRRINTPDTSSLGRVFDAAAGLLKIVTHARYEAEAALRLEALVRRPVVAHAGTITPRGDLDLRPLFERLLAAEDPAQGADLLYGTLAAALARWLGERAEAMGRYTVALGGDCLLDRVLRRGLIGALEARGLTVLTPRAAPPGDGGVSLGQAWVAALRLEEG